MKTHLKILAAICLMISLLPVVVIFFGLFFYEGGFSWKQIAIQGGAQFILLNVAVLIGSWLYKLIFE